MGVSRRTNLKFMLETTLDIEFLYARSAKEINSARFKSYKIFLFRIFWSFKRILFPAKKVILCIKNVCAI